MLRTLAADILAKQDALSEQVQANHRAVEASHRALEANQRELEKQVKATSTFVLATLKNDFGPPSSGERSRGSSKDFGRGLAKYYANKPRGGKVVTTPPCRRGCQIPHPHSL